MAVGMIAIAGLTQFLIYFGTYAMYPLPNGRTAMDVVDYWTFLRIYLSNQRYSFGHAGTGPGVEVGNMGYAIAAVQMLGFLVGGGATFLILKQQAFCDKCGRYFRSKLMFSKQGGADFIDGLRETPALSPSYFGSLQNPHGTGFKLEVRLSQCPDCSQELVSEKIQMMVNKQWKSIPKFDRRILATEPVQMYFQSMPDAKRPSFARFRS
jgi:hypothetical protein